jgi:hypothetical protein
MWVVHLYIFLLYYPFKNEAPDTVLVFLSVYRNSMILHGREVLLR